MERTLDIQKEKLDSSPVQQITITLEKAFSFTFIIYKNEEIIPIFMGYSGAKYKMKSFIQQVGVRWETPSLTWHSGIETQCGTREPRFPLTQSLYFSGQDEGINA